MMSAAAPVPVHNAQHNVTLRAAVEAAKLTELGSPGTGECRAVNCSCPFVTPSSPTRFHSRRCRRQRRTAAPAATRTTTAATADPAATAAVLELHAREQHRSAHRVAESNDNQENGLTRQRNPRRQSRSRRSSRKAARQLRRCCLRKKTQRLRCLAQSTKAQQRCWRRMKRRPHPLVLSMKRRRCWQIRLRSR